jgi:hypothetical protein
MFVKTHDHLLAANDHRHAARTRDSDHFIQSVAVFTDIKLNVLDSFSRKELLRLATVVSSREAVNLDLLHSRLLLGFMFSRRTACSRAGTKPAIPITAAHYACAVPENDVGYFDVATWIGGSLLANRLHACNPGPGPCFGSGVTWADSGN